MYLGWNVWLTVLVHQILTITAGDSISSEIQGYENLIPYKQLYQTCLEENLRNCEVFKYEDVDKRSPKFNAWGGKRAKFSSWGGKRNSPFIWGGKGAPYFMDDLDTDSIDLAEKRAKFSSWGGKRDMMEDKRAKFNSWGGKRTAKFSSWGGKRAPELFAGVKRGEYDGLGYKKKPAFSSWGGKRSDLSFLNEAEELIGEEQEHSLKKRDTAEEEFEDHMPDLWKEFFDRISNPNFNKKNPYDQEPAGTTVQTISAPVKKSPADSQLQRLFKQFVYWTGNQPGEKKNMVMNSRLFKDRTGPMRRGSADFYAWGGKRSDSLTQ